MPTWSMQQIVSRLANLGLVVGLLWLALALLTLVFLVMLSTRWGQSHATRKCMVLSLLGHLWLAGFSTTLPPSLVAVPERIDNVATVHIGQKEEKIDERPATEVAPSADAERPPEPPWEKLATARPVPPETVAPQRKPMTETPDADRRSAIEPAKMPGQPDMAQHALAKATVPEPPTPQAKPDKRSEPARSAEKIVVPAAQRQDDARPNVSAVPSPGRAETKKQAPSLAMRSATGGIPSSLFESSASLPRIAIQSGTPDPAGLMKELVDRAGASTKPGPAETAAVNVAGPQPLDSPDTASADGVPRGDQRLAKADPLAVAKKSDRTPATAEKHSDAQPSIGPPLAILPRIEGESSAHQVPDLYKLRVAPNRAQLAERHGATTETEADVKLALKWLAHVQASDGRWSCIEHGGGRTVQVAGQTRESAGREADSGMTGLALLSLLAAGNTHRDGEYREQVQRGLEYLLRTQSRNGSLGGQGTIYEFMYCHGIASFAMSEALGMSGDERLREPVRRALNYTIRAQDPVLGGWRYRPGDPGDMSQLGWQYMALKSGELAGLTMPDATRKGVTTFLNTVAHGKHGGLASYRAHERITPAMTAEAIFCWQLLGLPREHPAGREAGDYLLQELPGQSKANLYYWYYGTLAMYQLQGSHWTRWNEALRATLLSSQIQNGPLAGTWDPDGVWGGYGGRIYSTALSALCLEVYYRFLPLYRETGMAESRAE